MSLLDRAAGQVRIGDAEREAAVAALGEHYVAGRLTHDEHDERTSRAFAARVSADLWPLFRDLPAQAPRPPEARKGSRRRRGPGFAPILLVVIALVVLTEVPWPLVVVAGWIWWTRTVRRSWSHSGSWSHSRSWSHNGSWSHSRGSRRAVRGTWS